MPKYEDEKAMRDQHSNLLQSAELIMFWMDVNFSKKRYLPYLLRFLSFLLQFCELFTCYLYSHNLLNAHSQ